MEGIIFFERSAVEVDFYFDNVKIMQVISANVIFTPESPDVVNKFTPEQMKELAEYTAPWVAKQLKLIQG